MKLVKESLLEQKSAEIELSAGLVIIQEGAILLGHPTGQKWWGTYSIPKGHVESGEDLLEAAIRETREEIGISINEEDIEDTEPLYIDYKDKLGVPYKRVYYFVVKPKTPITAEEIVPDKKEIDWAGFVLKEKAEQRIFWRLKPVLENIEETEEEETPEEGGEEGGLGLGEEGELKL
jgi:ADP-ribose pyrophosphatase YjhB (NUDIX family)